MIGYVLDEYYLREDAEECLNYAGQTILLIEKLTK